MSGLVFESMDYAELPVQIGQRHFVLREASVKAVDEYQDALDATTLYNDKGVRIGVKGIGMADTKLLSMCLYEKKDGSIEGVSVDELLGWKNRIRQELFKQLKRISNIDQPDTEESINELLVFLQKRLEVLKKGNLSKNDESSSEIASS